MVLIKKKRERESGNEKKIKRRNARNIDTKEGRDLTVELHKQALGRQMNEEGERKLVISKYWVIFPYKGWQ